MKSAFIIMSLLNVNDTVSFVEIFSHPAKLYPRFGFAINSMGIFLKYVRFGLFKGI